MLESDQNSHESNVTLAILAGGEGSRMGMAKGLLRIDGIPILEHLLNQISWPGQTMLVTAPGREHPPGWNRFSREVCDLEAGGGPLRGVLTALENLTTPLLLVQTVDMPNIGIEQLTALLHYIAPRPKTLGVMMRRRIDDRFQIEPFPCVLRTAARPVIQRRIAENRRSIHGVLEERGFFLFDALATWHTRVWTNLNEPSDLASTSASCESL